VYNESKIEAILGIIDEDIMALEDMVKADQEVVENRQTGEAVRGT